MEHGTEKPGTYRYVQWTGDDSVLPEIVSLWKTLLNGEIRATVVDENVQIENDFGSGFHDAGIEPPISPGMYVVQGPYWDEPAGHARVLTQEQFEARIQPSA